MLGSRRLRLLVAFLTAALLVGASEVIAEQPSPTGLESSQAEPQDEALGSLSRLTVSPVSISG
ncbi:MAG: hypothetical protein EBZ48_13495, partial [Proteobacteria bacterium]|nr:hypothetical protein [Pseudomonadota bacterium]